MSYYVGMTAEFKALRDSVQQAGGVQTVYASELRDAIGAGRLTQGVNSKISDELRAQGLGHVPHDPEDLPTSQWELVRLYDLGSAVGKVVLAAQLPGEANDRTLIESVTGDAADILEKVRVLVAE